MGGKVSLAALSDDLIIIKFGFLGFGFWVSEVEYEYGGSSVSEEKVRFTLGTLSDDQI